MNIKKGLYLFIVTVLLTGLFSCEEKKNETKKDKNIYIETSKGILKLKLYDETPEHKKMFEKLVSEDFYKNKTIFRIRENELLELGEQSTDKLKENNLKEELIKDKPLKAGTLIAVHATENELTSSLSRFCIVTGKKYTQAEIGAYEYSFNAERKEKLLEEYFQKNPDKEKEINELQRKQKFTEMDTAYAKILREINFMPFKISEKNREVYETEGGLPHFEGFYTVFGEITEGLDILEKIADTETDLEGYPAEKIKFDIYVGKKEKKE